MIKLAGSEAQTRRSDVLAALGLAVAAMIALGFSRFAYALLLPPMREAMALTYTEAGSLNSANGLGYVFGALACAAAFRRSGIVPVFRFTVLGSALLLIATPIWPHLGTIFVLRMLGGFTTAFVFIGGAALAAGIAPPGRHAQSGLFVAIFVAGGGAGIALSGLLVPLALAAGSDGWRLGWLLLGAMAVIGVVPAWWAAGRSHDDRPRGTSSRPLDARHLLPTTLGYTLFGAGYSGFMTFVIAFVRSNSSEGIGVTPFWVALGLASMACAPFWGRVLGRASGGHGPALAYALTMAGTMPLLLSSSAPAALATAIVFGGSIMAGPASIAIVARQQASPSSVAGVVAGMTVAFALGQAIGPLLSGAVTDWTGSEAMGLWTSPMLLGLGALVALGQKPAPSA